jgi:ubiquinone/menaquinone biosynthesis C-methylase UbiE
MDKRLQDHIEHYRKDSEAFDYFHVENKTIREEERRRIELLSRQIKLHPGQHLIDCGSGGGWVSKSFLPRGVFVCAVDLASKNLAGIRQRFDTSGQGGYVVADLNHLPFKKKSFDAATSNDVYEHLEDLDKAAIELKSVLKSKARAFISVPYRENIVYYLCIHCNKLTPINAHLHSFDENNLGSVFTRNGYHVERIEKFTNKALAMLQLDYYLLRWLPFVLWRLIDSIANAVIRKPGRMAMVFSVEEN